MKLTKKLFITIMTMALLVVTFSASTFAWFTLGQESKIENIKVNVMAGAGMEISVDGKEWRNNISLKDALSENLAFGAITTYLEDKPGINFYDEKGVLVENGANTMYFEQTFYVRITNRNRDLEHDQYNEGDFDYISLSQVLGDDITFTDDNKWIADVSFGNGVALPAEIENGPDSTLLPTAADKYEQFGEGITPAKYDAQTLYGFDPLNAVKISFTVNETASTTEADLLFGYENASSQGSVSPNGVAKAYADAKGYELALASENDTDYNLPEYKTFSDVDEHELTVADAIILEKDDFGAANTVFTGDDAPKEADNFLYAKVTIRIWLDGWDADCINAILDKETTLSFKLTAGNN